MVPARLLAGAPLTELLEGWVALDAIMAADIHARCASDGLDLLFNPLRCKAILRA